MPVAGIAPEEAVVHRALRPDVAHGPRLMDVEVSGSADAEPHGAAMLWLTAGSAFTAASCAEVRPGAASRVPAMPAAAMPEPA